PNANARRLSPGRAKPLPEWRSRPYRCPGRAPLAKRETEIGHCRQSIPIRRRLPGRERRAWASRNSLVEAALSHFDKFHEFPDIRRTVQLRANLFQGLRGVEFGTEQE